MRHFLVRALTAIGVVAVTLVVAGVIYLASFIRSGLAARDEPSALEMRLARTMRRLAAPPRARHLKNPLLSTSAVLAAARVHWADHCASCHANDGSGDTPIGKNLYPKAPDMRAQETQRLTDGELYYIIQNGIRLTGMPA